MEHLIAADFYNQMLYQLSYSRLVNAPRNLLSNMLLSYQRAKFFASRNANASYLNLFMHVVT